MPATSFPLDAITTILNMVRGSTAFDLLDALAALQEIAQYAKSFYDAEALQYTQTPDLSLEEALMMLRAKGTGAYTTALNTSFWSLVIEMVLGWLQQKAANGQS